MGSRTPVHRRLHPFLAQHRHGWRHGRECISPGEGPPDDPVGTGYAVWTGIGAVGTAAFGMILFDESRDALRVLSILLIVAGIVGLRLLSSD